MDTPLPDLPTTAPTSDALGSLSTILYASDSFEEVYSAIVTTAVRVVDGCDHASIMQLGRDGHVKTAVSTDDIARTIDKLEQLHQEGPCFDAIVEDAPQFEDDLADPTTQWPALAEQIVRQTPVRSAAGFRIIVGDEKIGALNLFNSTQPALSAFDHRLAQALADVATIGILQHRTVSRASVLVEQLQLALNTRISVEQAKGVISEFGGVDMGVAFEAIRSFARSNRLKLSSVAEALIRRDLQPSLVIKERPTS